MHIIVDSREMRTNIVKTLFELGVEIQSKMLPVGDFILSESVGVERKTKADFLGSIIDGRLFEQVSNLCNSFEKPVLVLEGVEDIYSLRQMNPKAIRGALSSLAIDFRLPIIWTDSEEETAQFIYTIAFREQIVQKKPVYLRGEKKPLTDNELREFLVSGLPGVGTELAKNLLKHFKTVENIFTSGEEKLKKTPKIGEKKAKKIREIVSGGYTG
jgi:Fanconi anemia group M protein